MINVFKVADVLVSHVLNVAREDVDIVGYYGSHATGTARDDSDLDIFYIPADGKNPPVGRAFLLGGHLFDFWAIPWPTMEGFATGRIRGWAFAPALVSNVKVLHARSEEHIARLASIKEQTLNLQKPEARPLMIRRAIGAFGSVMIHVGNVHAAADEGDFAGVRFSGWSAIASSLECLALANQTFFDGGLRRCIDQLSNLEHRPEGLDQMIVCIATSMNQHDIVTSCDRLAEGTRQVLSRLGRTLPASASVRERFNQTYPEMKDMVCKLLSACKEKERFSISSAAWALQSDISKMLSDTRTGAGHSESSPYGEFSAAYKDLGLPDLMSIPPDQVSRMVSQAKTLDERLRNWLKQERVGLEEFDTVEDLQETLQGPRSS